MSKTIRAKFLCNLVEEFSTEEGVISGKQVSFTAVIANKDGSSSEENKSFSNSTPSGSLNIFISNPDALDFFQTSKEYYLDFTASEVAAADPFQGVDPTEPTGEATSSPGFQQAV